MRPSVLALAFALALPPAVVLGPNPSAPSPRTAEAAVSVLVSLDELVAASRYVVVATATERHSAWEELPSGRRIVTYTKLVVDRSVVGAPGSEVWVRTLGGNVDRIGQAVSGEARIAIGSRSLLFLADEGGVLAVTALAQGHYPVLAAESAPKLAASPDAGTLLPRPGPTVPARDRLVGSSLDAAVDLVARTYRSQHAPK